MKKVILIIQIILIILIYSCEDTTRSKNDNDKELDSFISILGEVNKVSTFDFTIRVNNYTPTPLDLPDTINSRTIFLDSLYDIGVFAYGYRKYITTINNDTLKVKKLYYDYYVYDEIQNELKGIPQSEYVTGENYRYYVFEDSTIYNIGFGSGDYKSAEYIYPIKVGNTYKNNKYGDYIFTIEKDTVITTEIGDFLTYKTNISSVNYEYPVVKYVNPEIGLVKFIRRYHCMDTVSYICEEIETLKSIENLEY